MHTIPAKLPPGQQRVVRLHKLEDLPLTEAVWIIGMSIPTFSILPRARGVGQALMFVAREGTTLRRRLLSATRHGR